MSGPKGPEGTVGPDGADGHAPGDDFHAEVSDLRPAAPATGRSLPLQPRRSRQRTVRWAVGLVLALLVVLAASVPAARDRALAVIIGPTAAPLPAPTATRGPGDDLFYLLPNPPGVTVSVDGRALGQLPLAGSGQPLRLPAGRHTFTWTSTLFPFRTLTCQVSVPPAKGDSCPLVTQRFSPNILPNNQGHIIALHESLAALVAPEGAALTAAIGTAVAGVVSSGSVLPSEPYLYYDDNTLSYQQTTAQQTLRATLTFQFLTLDQAVYPEPCLLAALIVPCRAPGQDCTQVCTVVNAPATVAPDPTRDWIGAVMVRGYWAYTLPDGTAVAQDDGAPLGLELMAVRITRDSSGWHVSPIIGHTPGFPLADDPVCDEARYVLGQTTWSFMLVDPPPGAVTNFVSGPDLADGCAVSLGYGPPNPAGLFLQRFGVVSTVDSFARNPTDNLPVADVAEQQLAQQLLASAGN